MQNATSVVFPTWWIAGNQADLQWLQGTNDGGGTWHVDVPLSQFDPSNPRYGLFETDVYMSNASFSNIGCGGGNWTRQAPVPSSPTAVTVPVSSSTSTFTVNWTPATSGPTPTYYVLEQATSASGPWTQVGSNITAPASSASVTVSSNGTYYYEVAACNANGCSRFMRGTNVGAASAGATPTASSIYTPAPGYPVSGVNDGDRSGVAWGNGGGWNDDTKNTFPDWVTIAFNGSQPIQSIVVYTLQDNLGQGIEPTETLTFSKFGLTAFDVQTWNGSAWVTQGSVTGNNLVMRTVTFNSVSTNQIRVLTNGSADGQYSRIVEVEALNLASVVVNVPAVPQIPSSPTAVTVPAGSTTGIFTVNWTPATSGLTPTYYVLEQAPSPSGPWTQVGSNITAPASSAQVTVFGNGTYYYEVAACNANGCSRFMRGTNVAAASAGATPAASSTYTPAPGYPVSGINDGDRTGVAWGNGGGWNDNTKNTFPDWVTIAFSGSQPIQSVVVYTLQDNLGQGIEPNDTLTFSKFGLTAFDVQTWDGSTWVTQGSVTGNNLVMRTVTFSSVTTNQIRIVTNGSVDGQFSRIVEVEALNLASVVVTTHSGPVVVGPPPPPSVTAVVDLPTHDATVGTLAGQASSDGGAAQYHVPIVVPPGRAGMQPELALVYNSRSGNGVMGMGWTISGLSSIHRCPQTPEQDGRTLGVSYTNNDRLCLDGQRLVLVSGGSYGAANAVYRTEVDSYARITQVGGDLTGANTCFRVEQKDGRVLHYGAVTGTISNGALSAPSCAASTANSTVTPSGAPAPLSWLVEKIEDRTANNQLYQYTNVGYGEVLINKISYTGFGTTAGDRTVTFAYEPRSCDGNSPPCGASGVTDVSSSYLAGGLTMQTQALASITTATASGTVRSTTMSYIASQYSGRLMLSSLKECATDGSNNSCHTPTTFSYNDSAFNFSLDSLSNLALSPDDLPVSAHPIGDLDGDGAPEAIVLAQSQSTHSLHTYLEQVTADGQAHSAVDLTGYLDQPYVAGKFVSPSVTEWNWVPRQSVFVDVDGDGRSKLLLAYVAGSSTTVNFGVWKGGRGALASSLVTAANATTPDQNYNALFTTVSSNIPWPTPANASTFLPQAYVADVNGDGKPDIIIVAEINSCINPVNTSPPSYGKAVYVYLNAMSGALTAGQTAQFTAPSSPICLTFTGSAIGASVQFDHIADFNGNGLPDLFYTVTAVLNGGPSNQSLTNDNYCVTPLVTTGTTVSAGTQSCYFNETHTTYGTQSLVRWTDVNGDGLEDLVIATPAGSGSGTWTVQLNRGGTLASAIDTQSTAGLQTGWYSQFRYANKTPALDVDGDGKPDLLTPSVSNPFALKVCMMTQGAPLNNGQCPTAAAPQNTSSGVVSSNLICPVYACPEEPGSSQVNLPVNKNWSSSVSDGAWNEYVWNDENGTPQVATGIYTGGPNAFAQTQGQLLSNGTYLRGISTDDSVYHMDMLKFVQTGPTAFTVQTVPTPIISRLNYALISNDTTGLAGNGLSSPLTPVGCLNPNVTTSSGTFAPCAIVGDGNFGPATLPNAAQTPTSAFQPTPISGSPGTFTVPVALYGNTNHGVVSSGTSVQATVNALSGISSNCPAGPVLPGLLATATDGLGDTAQWGYDSLALGRLCTRDGVPEYAVDDGYLDLRHYYFASSMPVVSAMLQSNGIGGNTGSRSAIYSYGDAMYNHYGRGFQGFHTIAVENATSDASRRLITTTTFHQKFPLVGRVAQVSTQSAPSAQLGGRVVHSEADTYTCNLTNRQDCTQIVGNSLPVPTGSTVYQVVLDTQTTTESDLGGAGQSAHTVTVNAATANAATSGWDSYGNLLNQIVTRGDDAASGQFVSSHTITTTNSYNSQNVTNWMINLPTETKVQSSIVYARALPVGASAPSQTVDTQYVWNTDRTPQSKTLQPQSVIGDVNQQSTTSYSYPTTSYGLPSQVQVSGPSITPSRTTSYGYSSDGYFVAGMTNGLGQTTLTTVQARDGQVKSSSDPNSIVVNNTYDVFGRATQTTHTGSGANVESPINVAYSSCAGGCTGVAHDANETFAAYRIVTTQEGYPTKVSWHDALSRPVKQAQAGFSGTTSTALQYTFSATLTDYDESGTVLMQSTPYYVGTDTPYFVGFTYDALGRTLTKLAQNSCSGGNMTTTYAYVGRQTNITASGTCPGGTANTTIKMSRSTNVLGQLMQTIDANGNTTFTNGKTTSYWTEPLGHVVAMQDVEGNLTTASYNALGQRTQSNDPDQGAWTFSYDALGELVSQTDARSAVTSVTSRDALGRILTRTEVPPATVPTGEATDKWTDVWSYDPPNGIGQVSQVTRQRGPNTPPTTNPVVWQETYTYNPQSLLSSVATKVAEDATVNFTSGTTYDTDGRVATQTYPSNLIVRRSYTAYGQLDALSNDSTGFVYWVGQAQNAWGHVTQEQYAGVINGTHTDFAATGQSQVMDYAGTVADHVAYTYDSFGNLAQQVRSGQAGYTETYVYDSLQRLTQATRNGTAVNYSYSPGGNLTQKSDFAGTYSYATANTHSTSGCGPHAVNAAGSATYSCDANGNVIGGSTIAVTYDQENHARTAARTGVGNTSWAHSTSGQIAWNQSSRGSRYYGPNGYEQIGTGTNAVQVHELGPVVVTRTGGSDQVSVVLRDRLGSTIDEVDNNVPTPRSYDAFGRPLESTGTARDTLNLTNTIHGFTKHEHDDDVLLINMVGRIYDYKLGRFLQVDPVIQAPHNSQSLNPYSYVLNNPLAGKDPTGYSWITPEPSKLKIYSVTTPCAFSNCTQTLFDVGPKQHNGLDNTTAHGASSSPSTNRASDTGSASKLQGRLFAQVAEPPVEVESESVERDEEGRAENFAVRFRHAWGRTTTEDMIKQIRTLDPKYQPPVVASGPGAADYYEILQRDLNQRVAEKLGIKEGSFSITDWTGYPSGVPRPTGPVQLIEGTEYENARDEANKENARIRRQENLKGQKVDIHEVQPIKFNGSPTDPANKAILPRDLHRQQLTPWWNQLQKDVENK